jgi:RecJ-like exonuclease
MGGPIPALEARAAACADRLVGADAVLLASHIDADGLTSAAVAATALERAGIPFETVFEKQLDEAAISRMAATDFSTVLFTDFGSGQLDAIAEHEAAGEFVPVVADHHRPADADTEYHLNPLLVGIDGASELSGAGTTYALARALAERDATNGHNNRDLAALAAVGSIGDMQASGGELVGANSEIVAEGIAAGTLEATSDLALYGRQTRPLPKLLEYASDVSIPGITNDERGAIGFLADLDLDLRHPEDGTGGRAVGEGSDDTHGGGENGDAGGGDGSIAGARAGEWRRWVDLDGDERRTVASALVRRALDRGVPAERVEELVGTTYTLPTEPEGTELRDASEFSTLLNATARYDRADVGLAVCLGERDGALDRARRLLATHRRNLSEGLRWVEREGVTRESHLQWFDAGERIRETIVGIVAGMALGSDGVSGGVPIVAFARESTDETKVSARGTHRLVGEGLDLSAVMSAASAAVGGAGGGHDVAAGATIPSGSERAFVKHADTLVGEQLG